jgi:hypothetical protein
MTLTAPRAIKTKNSKQDNNNNNNNNMAVPEFNYYSVYIKMRVHGFNSETV